ncbi:MAG TPA: hypothetical protein VNN07_14535, partial [Candidatus Tectomicrobia bacterium]|nr:hypothetical protein [Candidatus Tectomicrobia bacterium]
MELSLGSRSARVGVVVMPDRLLVAVVRGRAAHTFAVEAEQPGVVLREQLAQRRVAARSVAVALTRSTTFVKAIELPATG